MNSQKDLHVTKQSILVNPEDIHCLIFHFICLVAYGLAFWLYLHPEIAHITGWRSRIAFVAASALMLGWISGIDVGVNFHNHVHRKFFRQTGLNRWLSRFWTFSGGWCSFLWEYHHLMIHHPQVMRESDWTGPRLFADGRFENIYRFCLCHYPWRYAFHLWQDFRAGGRGGIYTQREAIKELSIFLVLWSIPFWINPMMALCLWVLPHYVANVVIMGSGMYVQHVGGVKPSAEHPYRHSLTSVCKFYNLTMFNIGYHIEHHVNPSLHWSLLPAYHEVLKPELIKDAAHVVCFGHYHWGIRLLLEPEKSALVCGKFACSQHPDYVLNVASSGGSVNYKKSGDTNY